MLLRRRAASILRARGLQPPEAPPQNEDTSFLRGYFGNGILVVGRQLAQVMHLAAAGWKNASIEHDGRLHAVNRLDNASVEVVKKRIRDSKGGRLAWLFPQNLHADLQRLRIHVKYLARARCEHIQCPRRSGISAPAEVVSSE